MFKHAKQSKSADDCDDVYYAAKRERRKHTCGRHSTLYSIAERHVPAPSQPPRVLHQQARAEDR